MYNYNCGDIAMNNELKQIKKIYGEEMMHLCREMFPSILEKEGLLLSILENNLAPTHSFPSDIKEHYLYEEFKDWIYRFVDVEKKDIVVTEKTPFQLMDEAGYTLYECKTEEDIQSFRKYYADGEVLCTIYNGGRLNRCHVFFAVKKNVDEIKRENFTNPQREDKYGTSVISIQFSRGKINTLSIKNRYNHTVNKPDATFSNNLEKIIPGLTYSFEKYYGFNVRRKSNDREDFLIDELKYVKGKDGKYYRYNLEINGYYYCENNIIIEDGRVFFEFAHEKERYILMEQYVIDIKDKMIYSMSNQTDSFVKSINDVGKIQNIEVTKNGENRVIIINYIDDKIVKIEINKNNAIVGYENDYVTEIDSFFLVSNEQLNSISLPQVQKIGDTFLDSNQRLSSISLPQVQKIGNSFLYSNRRLSSISLPQVQKIGDGFLCHNKQISSISLPQVQEIGKFFLRSNKQLSSISLPQVQKIGNGCLASHPKSSQMLERMSNEEINNSRNK